MFHGDMDVDEYINNQQSTTLTDFFEYLRTNETDFATGDLPRDTISITVRTDTNHSLFLFAAVIFGCKWKTESPHLLADEHATVDEFIAATHPPELKNFFKYLRQHQVAFEANDLHPSDVTVHLDSDTNTDTETPPTTLDIGPALYDAVKFGIKWQEATQSDHYILGDQ